MTTTIKLVLVEFYKNRPTNPHNLDEAMLSWSPYLSVEHGGYGSFIDRNEYFEEPTKQWSNDMIEGLNEFEEEIVKKTFIDDITATNKSNRKGKEARAKMFAIMFMNISEPAKAQLRRDPGAAALILNANDPLELWRMLQRTLTTTNRGDTAATQMACVEGFMCWGLVIHY